MSFKVAVSSIYDLWINILTDDETAGQDQRRYI